MSTTALERSRADRPGRRPQHVRPKALRKMELGEKIIRLRRNGLSYRAIGAELGLSKGYVESVCRWAYREYVGRVTADVSLLLGEELDRMDGLIRAASAVLVSSRSTPAEKMRALAEIRKCSEAKVRWTGAGAPDKLLVGSMDSREDLAQSEVAGLSDEALTDELAALGWTPPDTAADAAVAGALAEHG